jgi:hypothetical protein
MGGPHHGGGQQQPNVAVLQMTAAHHVVSLRDIWGMMLNLFQRAFRIKRQAEKGLP